MSPAEQREEILFEAALKLPAAERPAYLNQACADDAGLRRRVEVLLLAFERAGGFLNQPATPERTVKSPIEKPGDRIGRYKLLEQIGEGGCGVVYVAEQEEPVRRRVALKVIKLGMDTKQVIARFDAERQALALMDHPNIAKIHDAGTTDTGRPYFVMELVRGTKITDYCEQNSVSLRERLDLFIQVCRAIQHAHQKGIIHRDIKPSNILVTVNDGAAVPKVIDFGIAKATQGRLTNQTVYTAFEQFVGTPAYMSPEQAVMTSLDIDTRSDIYSLGVLLYELLTGRPPFDQKELLAAGLDEMRRTIREVEPIKPSTRLTRERSARLAASGKSEIGYPRSKIDNDLDWIVMKCLEKDRTRRYETANGVGADVQRYLNNEPVLARPPSKLYEFRKTIRRHKFGFTAATALVIVLTLGVLGLAISNSRIREAEKLMEAALDESKAQLFESLKSQAAARRQSRQIGQREESLAALRTAAEIRRDADLRDAAIAALAVPDLRLGSAWRAYDSNDLLISFDANYERYATIDKRFTISVRRVADNREILRLSPGTAVKLEDHERALRFSPDGRLLAQLDAKNVLSIWRIADGHRILLTGSRTFAFSRDSARVAVFTESSIVVFDLLTGKERQRWRYLQMPRVLAFSPNDRQLAVGPIDTEMISIFEVDTGHMISELPAGKSADRAVAWHPSGRYLAVSSDRQIQFWDVEAGAKVSSLEGHAQIVTTVSFDPSGSWLIADAWDGTPRLWQPSPERELLRFFSGLNHLRFSEDGRWAGVAFPGDGNAQLLEFIPSQIYRTFVSSLMDRQFSITYPSVSPDGRLLALSAKGIPIRELPSGRELTVLPPEQNHVAFFHPNGRELIVGSLQGVQVWPITNEPKSPEKLRFGPPRLLPLPFVPVVFALAQDGDTMALSAPGEARIVDLSSGALRDVTFPHPGIDTVALTPDAQWLATSGWQSLRVQIWNTKTGERALELTGERMRVSFTPDGREFVISSPQTYVFYDVTTHKVIRRFERQSSMHPGWIAFSHDGTLMAMELSPGVIHLAEVKTGRAIANLTDPNGCVNAFMVFTPDDTQIIVAAAYERAIHRWDLRALRVELKAMGLDWDWPEFPRLSSPPPVHPALKVEVFPE